MKPSLKLYRTETETLFVRKVAVIVNEQTHPELKGMTVEEMKKYVEDNMSTMKAVKPEYNNSLEDEVLFAEEEYDKYFDEKGRYNVDIATEEDLNIYGSHGAHDDDDEHDAEDDEFMDDDGDDD